MIASSCKHVRRPCKSAPTINRGGQHPWTLGPLLPTRVHPFCAPSASTVCGSTTSNLDSSMQCRSSRFENNMETSAVRGVLPPYPNMRLPSKRAPPHKCGHVTPEEWSSHGTRSVGGFSVARPGRLGPLCPSRWLCDSWIRREWAFSSAFRQQVLPLSALESAESVRHEGLTGGMIWAVGPSCSRCAFSWS